MLTVAAFCLALNVYHEARGEFIPGQYAVALVTYNRAHRDPKRICPTVFKPHQFSWTNHEHGLVRKVRSGYQLTHKGVPKNKRAWQLAVKIAKVTLSGRMNDFLDATYYHRIDVKPAWRKGLELVGRIGQHLFYRKR